MADPDVFEVSGQERPKATFSDARSLHLVLARRLFCRRSQDVELWVVPRPCVHLVPRAGEPLGPAQPLSYRLGTGYRGTLDKWKRFGGEPHGDR